MPGMDTSDRTRPPSPGVRARRKLATREGVRSAAVRLSERHGLDGVTVEMIAHEAGVSVRTFFNHFPSKEDAVLAVVRARAADLVEAFRARPADEPALDAVREAALGVLAGDDGDPDTRTALHLAHHDPALQARQMAVLLEQESALAAAIADRVPAGDAQVLAAVALAALRVAQARGLASGGPDHAARLAAEIDSALRLLRVDPPGGGTGR